MKQCVFCGRAGKMSAEHIWSEWIGKLFQPQEYTFVRRDHATKTARTFTMGMDATLKAVCKRCNEGWMSTLEWKHAKPAMEDMIARGAAKHISLHEIASIAAFAFKTTVLANCMSPANRIPRFFSSDTRLAFAESLAIPPHFQVWIASYKSTHGEVRGVFKSVYGKCPDDMFAGFELYVCTFSVGFLVLQTVASRFRQHPQVPFPGFRQDNIWDEAANPIWPNTGVTKRWPPLRHLGDDTIQRFCYRWEDFTVPEWLYS